MYKNIEDKKDNNALLEEKLVEYNKSDYYGFHMPGHKRNEELLGKNFPYGMDITEIGDFDDLHHADGILLEARKRAAKVFSSSESFYLINGSTVGNLAAILSVTDYGDKILIARNNHKSVYNAVYLNRLKPKYVYPEYEREYGINGAIMPDSIESILSKEEGIKAVVIVSPTYDGVVSDVKAIADLVHKYGIPLIVDEAHGAHFGLHEYFPLNSNQLGADVVVHSVHKTLPSLTQTGLIHVNGNIVNRDKVMRYLKMLQSSSPSYILMASIDKCVNILENQGELLFYRYVKQLKETRNKLKTLKNLHLIKTEVFDRSKIVISTNHCNISSKKLYNILLEKYHLQMEMCGPTYVTAMTSIADSIEGFKRLEQALKEIDETLECELKYDRNINSKHNQKHHEMYSDVESKNIRDRYNDFGQLPHLQQAKVGDEIGVSEWFYYLYPPGIPMVVPGEIIDEEINQLMRKYEEQGFVIQKG